MLCQLECACLHKTINVVVFFVKRNENDTYPKGRPLIQMYRVVPITERAHHTLFVTYKNVINECAAQDHNVYNNMKSTQQRLVIHTSQSSSFYGNQGFKQEFCDILVFPYTM